MTDSFQSPLLLDGEIDLVFLTNPTAEQLGMIVGLYRQAGWWPAEEAEDLDRLARLVRQSHCFVAAMAHGRMIGMGRAISDGVSDAYIQDVVVDANWRRSGVGTRIVRLLLERLQADGIGWTALIAERGSSPFYDRFGFKEMANAKALLLTR